MEPRQILDIAATALDNKKAHDLRLLEITALTTLADYFIIATGGSTTHLRTLSEEVELALKRHDILPLHTEGRDSGNWLLLDYGSVVVHLFLHETREFYALERLWSDAKQLDITLGQPPGSAK